MVHRKSFYRLCREYTDKCDRLYMAPEILRYEKYDAKADLWSVGAVLFEMSVGRPPFRANNHVELLRRIEKSNDNIVFPDEKERDSKSSDETSIPVSPDIKALIRALLKRKPNDRMGFDDFFNCGVWDGHMAESTEEESSSLDVSTDSSTGLGESDRIRQMVASTEQSKDRLIPTRAPQPLAADVALNPQPAVLISRDTPEDRSRFSTPPSRPTPTRRSTPKYYVGDAPSSEPTAIIPPTPSFAPTPRPAPVPEPGLATQHSPTSRANPRPIITAASSVKRRMSGKGDGREASSVEESVPLTPPFTGPSPTMPRPSRGIGEGSPLAAAPPITMGPDGKVGRSSALEGSSSGVGTDYVVVEKQTVEINALADGE